MVKKQFIKTDNMRYYFNLMLIAVMSVSLLSCKDKTGEWLDRTPIARVIVPEQTADGSITIDGKSQKVPFCVISSGAWTAKSSDESYTFLPSSGGTGRTEISLIAPSNESGSVKELTCSFEFEGGNRLEYILRQEIQVPYLEISPRYRTVLGDGEEFIIEVDTNQSEWALDLGESSSWINVMDKSGNSVTMSVLENPGSSKRSAEIRFYSVGTPEICDYLSITQSVMAAPPVADLLDVIFNADGSAQDNSAMKMTVDKSRLDADCSTVYLEKYGRYAARFNNPTIARSGLASGYYFIPYTEDSDFGKKLADGYSYELLFCTYYDPTGLAQVKPFASTQAGGTGMCFRANNGEINFETHVGGGWKELYSGIIPEKNRYYHVVATWDKASGAACLYVDGQLTVSLNASGDFKFMTTNVDKRWFGIGADPSASDTGEASFYGEVVIARLYDAPMSSEEARALYKLVK